MPIRMFYCPDICHEIAITGEGGTASSGSITPAGGGNRGGSPPPGWNGPEPGISAESGPSEDEAQ